MKSAVDVLVVGAGPVGLFLATALKRDGLDVMLIDRMAERTFFTKALGITPRSLELFDDFGIAQDAVDAGTWLHGVTTFNDGVPGASMDIPPGLPFGSLSLAQFEVERRAIGQDLVENTSRALNETLAQRSPLPGLRETQLLISYRGSAIVRDERADTTDAELAAGDRAPDAGGLRRTYVEQPFRLHERLGRGRHVLISYAMDDAGLTAAAGLADLCGQRWGRLCCASPSCPAIQRWAIAKTSRCCVTVRASSPWPMVPPPALLGWCARMAISAGSAPPRRPMV